MDSAATYIPIVVTGCGNSRVAVIKNSTFYWQVHHHATEVSILHNFLTIVYGRPDRLF